MATIFSHALIGTTISKVISPNTKRLAGLAALSAMLPDVDVIGFKFGVEYSSPYGHRGFTHSVLFAICWAMIVGIAFPQRVWRMRATLVIFLATLSHGIIDAMTNGGLGVGFFIPFHNERYFLPWRPIEVSPIGVGTFWERAHDVLASEFVWIGVPCVVMIAVRALVTVSQARSANE